MKGDARKLTSPAPVGYSVCEVFAEDVVGGSTPIGGTIRESQRLDSRGYRRGGASGFQYRRSDVPSGYGVFSRKLLCVVGPFMANGFRVWLSWTFVYSPIVLTKLPSPCLE